MQKTPEMPPIETLPVDRFYKSREEFTIIGLTGLAGSGCSTLASYMGNPTFFRDRNIIRSPQSLGMQRVRYVQNSDLHRYAEHHVNNDAVGKLIFKRKYSICYDFIKANYQPYTVIKYTHVIWLYILLYIAKQQSALTKDVLIATISEILKDKFYPSHSQRRDAEYVASQKQYGVDLTALDFTSIISDFEDITWDELIRQLAQFSGSYFIGDPDPTEDKRMLSDFFFGPHFQQFVASMTDHFIAIDYYCLCFFYHRTAYVIRGTGCPFTDVTEYFMNPGNDTSHLYDLISLVNFIIKGKRKKDDEGKRASTRVVIDSIRNSLESLYLKERYNAYYLIAVHDDANRETHLKQKIKQIFGADKMSQDENGPRIDAIFEKIKMLTDVEVTNDDYEKGVFSSSNVEQCIADAEIHISNEDNIEQGSPRFYTMAEQWMKYAALILHPGLITPSTEERCMMMAYTAKFNSSCLSRQVGAVITNQYHSIRTVGWNEVPYGQIPCGLRETKDHVRRNMISNQYYEYMYSEFERDSGKCYDNKKHSFIQKLDKEYIGHRDLDKKLHGLPFPYCFKSLQNQYEGEKNQVFTRSLHAEENAMLQMAKYGGEKLMNGIIYVTASPCELCSKKLYQIGIRRIVYIDPYPGIARRHIIAAGYKRPQLKLFQGVFGATYFKLFQPFMPFKDELAIRLGIEFSREKSEEEKIQQAVNDLKSQFSDEQLRRIIGELKTSS